MRRRVKSVLNNILNAGAILAVVIAVLLVLEVRTVGEAFRVALQVNTDDSCLQETFVNEDGGWVRAVPCTGL